MRRIAIWMHSGAIFGLLCAILGPDPEPGDHRAFAAIIAVELVALAVLATLRPTVGLMRVVGAYSVVITCLCVAVARPTNGVPLYTIWPVVLGAYAMSRRDFVAVLAMTVAGLAIAIGGFLEPPARLNLWVTPRATRACACSPTSGARSCAPATWPGGWAARRSRSSWRAPAPSTPAWSPSASPPACAPPAPPTSRR